MPPPIYVLYVVMAVGIVGWPLMKHFGLIQSTQETDLLAVAVLMLSYLGYKRWWQSQQGK
ncbi:MAG: hypothetical protein JWN93_3349 [Hyphomicrobiales bacterium]|jgi:hypothetical protein|nr:hypothetical protein [Hyphomicrobiales bacterium]